MALSKSMSMRAKAPAAPLGIGDAAPDFELLDLDGAAHRLSSFRGRRVLLSFFRFVGCPVCLYNVNAMKQRYVYLKRAGIVSICIFQSDGHDIARYAGDGGGGGNYISPETVLALSDKSRVTYKRYQLKNFSNSHLPVCTLRFLSNLSKYKPYLPSKEIRHKSDNRVSKQLPADFLIDEHGTIVDVFRAKNAFDTIAFDRIEAFVPEGRRCRCNSQECFTPRCQKGYAERQRMIASSAIFMG